jgi:hypothetical protein
MYKCWVSVAKMLVAVENWRLRLADIQTLIKLPVGPANCTQKADEQHQGGITWLVAVHAWPPDGPGGKQYVSKKVGVDKTFSANNW